MIRILDIALKDLTQFLRDFKTFMFLLLMPILFTFLFGYAFGGFGGSGESNSRLPVGFLNEDDRWISDTLHDLLADSDLIRLHENDSLSALQTWTLWLLRATWQPLSSSRADTAKPSWPTKPPG